MNYTHLSAASDRTQRGYSWIEVLLVIAIGLIVARYMWGREFVEQVSFLLFSCWLFRKYQDEATRLSGSGQPVVRPSVMVFVISSLVAAFLYLFFFVGSGFA